jgi:hypothetical protein
MLAQLSSCFCFPSLVLSWNKISQAYIKQHPHRLCKSKSWQGCHLHLQPTHTSRQTLTWLLGWPSSSPPPPPPPTTQPTNLLVVASKLNLLISPTNSHSTMATSTLIILFYRNVENFQTFFSSQKKKKISEGKKETIECSGIFYLSILNFFSNLN